MRRRVSGTPARQEAVPIAEPSASEPLTAGHGLSAAGELMGGAAFAAVAAFACIEALRLPRMGSLGFAIGAGLAPFVVGLTVLALSGLVVLESVRSEGHRHVGRWLRQLAVHREVRRWAILVLLVSGFVALLGRVAFWLACFLFMLASLAYLRVGTVWRIVTYSALTAALVGYAIPALFQMPLP